MSLTQLLLKSVWHYRRLNLTVILGVALSTAILLGALMIGDSVRFSLEQATMQRLGSTSRVVVAGERLFRKELANEIAKNSGIKTAALLRSNGLAIIDGGKSQFNQLAVWGADPVFGDFAGDTQSFQLTGNEAAINENLANLTGLKAGDEFLLRMNKLNTFPSNTPFVSVEESTISCRVTVKRIVKANQLGNFGLRNIQSSPRNVFLNLEWLNRQMNLAQKANVILVSEGIGQKDLISRLQQNWRLEDLNLKIRENRLLNYSEVISDRVFIETGIEEACISGIPGSYPVFTYFVNGFSAGPKNSPYSFVSTTDTLSGNQIAVSKWLADDLNIRVNDTLRLSYFEVGPLRRLQEKDARFIVSSIYKLEGKMADPDLMPHIPGLSDASNCRDWKTGVPVDLKKIRTEDETYWKTFKGTPKAFISLQTAGNLWGNSFGKATAIRTSGITGTSMEKIILGKINPSAVGYDIMDSKSEGMQAAANGVDFGQLFIGLSFFVLVAAFLLATLLFRLFLNYRKSETETLSAIGFPFITIRKLLFFEAVVLVIAGIVLGIPLSIGYNKLVLVAVNTIWNDIAGTSIARASVQPLTIILGAIAIFTLFSFIFFRGLIRFLSGLKIRNRKIIKSKTGKDGMIRLYAGLILVILSLSVLLFFGFKKSEINPDLFFAGGFGLLPGLILLFDFLLRKISSDNPRTFSFNSFIFKHFSGDRKRTLMAVSFLSIGIFLVIATGLYRKEMTMQADLPSSGTGGYNYFIETTLPVLLDPGSDQGRIDFGIPVDSKVVAFRSQPGDDASCLNLNRVTRPRILAFNPDQFDEISAFSFATRTDELDVRHPWLSLHKMLPGNVIPVIADQSVIQWSMGKKIGDTLHYKNEAGEQLKLKLIGGLENSVFQGNVLVAEDFFAKAFPSVSGANVFLVKTSLDSAKYNSFREEWRRYGAEITGTTERLQLFGRVENTYLNIFLMLGALGLLIGTAGLGILIFRTTLEQIPEYALLQSTGFEKSKIYRMLLTEKLLVVLAAVIIGAVPAAVSAIPVLFSPQHSGLWIWLPAVTVVVLSSGFLSGILALKITLKKNLVPALRND